MRNLRRWWIGFYCLLGGLLLYQQLVGLWGAGMSKLPHILSQHKTKGSSLVTEFSSISCCCEWVTRLSVQTRRASFQSEEIFYQRLPVADFDWQMKGRLTWPWPTRRCATSCRTWSHPIVLLIFSHYLTKMQQVYYYLNHHDCKEDYWSKRTRMCEGSKQFGFVSQSYVLWKDYR